jgi:hypothetical protein
VKLKSLYFDDQVVVPGYESISGGSTQFREIAFTAEEGWELHAEAPGLFRIWRQEMPCPVMVGGYGYSYVVEETPAPEPTPAEEPKRKGKR